VDDFFQVSGFMGHGFMMAPIIGKLLAQYMVEATDLPMFERWNLRRFKEGRLLSEAMIIG
jgi:sarcosine oxidase subunit beta